jgi:hypothetical protein
MRLRLVSIWALVGAVALIGAGAGLRPSSGRFVAAQTDNATPVAGQFPSTNLGPQERGATSALERAAAQPAGDGLSAGIYPGDCDQDDGDPEFELRDLTLQEVDEPASPVQTSFTTLDAPLADLVGAPFSILVLAGGEIALCGEIGEGEAETSRYVGLREVNASGYVGIAWLFGRDEETQVSLFVGQGLGGAPPTDGPPPSETEEPGPPDDPTEEPGPPDDPTEEPGDEPTEEPGDEPTPEPAAGGGESYTSESYEYTINFDDTWSINEEGSAVTEDDNGNPIDRLALTNRLSFVSFTGFTASIDPQTCVTNLAAGASEGEGVSNWTPKEDENGEIIAGSEGGSAFAAFDYTFTNDEGNEFEVSEYIMCQTITPEREILVFFQDTEQANYDEQSVARDELLAGLELP